MIISDWIISEKGPGLLMFKAVEKYFKDRFDILPVIAEDMGLLTDSVIEMVKESNFPSMKVLEFAFDSGDKNIYLPHNYNRNCVAYTGTHDNTTLRAWLDEQKGDVKEFIIKYLGAENTAEDNLHLVCIRTLFASVADTVIIPIQDYLHYDHKYRMNTPSTIGKNWMFRLTEGEIGEDKWKNIKYLTELYGRG